MFTQHLNVHKIKLVSSINICVVFDFNERRRASIAYTVYSNNHLSHIFNRRNADAAPVYVFLVILH